MTPYALSEIADRWRQYGRAYAVHPTLWDGSNVLSTLGPQTTSEGTKARDFSGRNNHGTLATGQTLANGGVRGASFVYCPFVQASSQKITLASSVSLGTLHTVSAWIRPNTQTGASNIGGVVSSSDASNVSPITIIYAYDNRIAYQESTGGSGVNVASLTGVWHHVVTTRSGLEIAIYLDGAPIHSGNLPGNSPAIISVLGCRTGLFYYDGDAAAINLWSRILTPNEISTIALGPLEAYAVRLPEYFTFTSTPSAGASPWLYDHGMVGGMHA